MKRLSYAVLAFLAISASHALAQGPMIAETRCWLGSMTFSPGATVRAADQVMVCAPEGMWEPTDRDAAGCVREGDFFAVGAVENIPNNKALLVACQPDGTWSEREAPQ